MKPEEYLIKIGYKSGAIFEFWCTNFDIELTVKGNMIKSIDYTTSRTVYPALINIEAIESIWVEESSKNPENLKALT